MENIHLVTYADKPPFTETQQLLNDTISSFTKYNVIKHSYNLEKLKDHELYTKMDILQYIYKEGRRDGYYCAYKILVSHDVYQKMGENDILYYIDSSQWFKNGFNQNIDKVMEYCYNKLHFIAGSFGKNILNDDWLNCCNKKYVWDIISPNTNYYSINKKPHICATWYMMRKTKENDLFFKEWIKYSFYPDPYDNTPLVTSHHPGDQVIFNILCYKYNLKSFYHPDIEHDQNKERNHIFRIINDSNEIDKYFMNPIDYKNDI